MAKRELRTFEKELDPLLSEIRDLKGNSGNWHRKERTKHP